MALQALTLTLLLGWLLDEQARYSPVNVASFKQFTYMRHLSLMYGFRVAVGPAMGPIPCR